MGDLLKLELGNGDFFSMKELEHILKQNQEILERVRAGEQMYADSLGWMDIEKWADDTALTELENHAAWVHKNADVFVLIGIGGSNQAARAVIKALQNNSGLEIIYAGNTISPYSMNEVLSKLEGKSVCINIIAKNFETMEPGIAFRVLRSYLEKRYGASAAERIFATGTPGSWLHTLCQKHGYKFLTFPEDIGGRYSVLSDVGLFPMAVAGIDIRALVKGACDMRARLYGEAAEENIAYRYAAVRHLLFKQGRHVEMLAFFEPRLHYFSQWWIQLFAESEGKDGQGLYPTAASFSEDLHSVGQFIQDGSPIMFETFLDVEQQDASCVLLPDAVDDRFSYLDGKDMWNINREAFAATLQAHSEKLPCLRFTLPRLDAYWFGQMFYFFLFSCYLSGSFFGVHPFDQPGVEAYKRYMFKRLGKE